MADVHLFFFFFQAEDGIRDGHVTVVQTCALPISPATKQPMMTGLSWALKCSTKKARASPGASPPLALASRSEERRVGKECRARRAPYHCRKKQSEEEETRSTERRIWRGQVRDRGV